ncbi:tRNA pseudouridine synthase B [Vittaforma corneae ATCC 50505]|uniref:H/ACA ribonucleoprotein complex subunit CBF5 n=1 Tax=Vittaforma corneae (strain ATCC 50505) TaxID=993615 RepID=L2GLG6_VITCO|nr:tRNA pseudouridine synthase B [Vittaforma corneae ATCC 50505]ELA41350.1 tRNA pseudouridine synthase B [Vittaforma corneae ATCC 50505]
MEESLLLLKNQDQMVVKSRDHNPSGHGTMPVNRPIGEYLKYGVVTVDKPANPSSHEVVTWVKGILDCEKTGHSGTLDPKVTGVLSICLNRATRLTKSQQNAGKTYVCCIEFDTETTAEKFSNACRKLTGHLFQRPPVMCAVKRDLRLRWIYAINIIEFTPKMALFEVRCEAGSYIRTLCTHIGLYIGCGAAMADLRRTQSGLTTEDECVTLHDVQDAYYMYKKTGEERYLRKVVRPLETLLVSYPRIMIRDSAVNAICYGGQLSVPGVLRYDRDFDTNSTVVLMTAKGEAVAIAQPLVASSQLAEMERGIITKTKRVIMEKDLYPRVWGILDEYEVLSD